jgi:hypothetical protein
LHIKEIETKIDNYNKNLKYDIRIKTNDNIGKESQKDTEYDNNDYKNLFEIRRNTFEMKKKKKNNEKSLVKILSGFIKEDYSNNKKQRLNTIDKINNESAMNLINENKRYENLKTASNEEIVNDNKDNTSSFIHNVKKSIKQKEHLLKISQGRSYKYMERKKAEIRSINMARNIKVQKDSYFDITSIFNKDTSSKNRKDRFGVLRSAKRKDLVLDNIIHNINKKSKYDKVLSCYLSEHTINDSIEEEKKDDKEKKERIEGVKNNNLEIKETINDSLVEDKQFSLNNKLQTDKNINNNSIVYPIIKSSFNNLVKNQKKYLNDIIKPRNNIITLDGLNSLGDYDLTKRKKNIKNKRSLDKMIDINHKQKINYKSIGIKNNKKIERMYRNFPNIISVYNKDDVSFVDPLVFDKFNNHYLHSYKKLSKS